MDVVGQGHSTGNAASSGDHAWTHDPQSNPTQGGEIDILLRRSARWIPYAPESSVAATTPDGVWTTIVPLVSRIERAANENSNLGDDPGHLGDDRNVRDDVRINRRSVARRLRCPSGARLIWWALVQRNDKRRPLPSGRQTRLANGMP